MHNHDQAPFEAFASFEVFFKQAESRSGYQVELAKLEFTRKVLERMQEVGMKKGQLAIAMGVQPGFVTRLLNGKNNFELGTMVRLAQALQCVFCSHLQPAGTEAMWINVLKVEPVRPVVEEPWEKNGFKSLQSHSVRISTYETISAAA